MKRPPLLMHLRFRNEHKDTGFGLWLPLFLLLPLVLVVFLILSPLILIALLVLWPTGWSWRAIRALGAAGDMFCSLRGLNVNVKSRDQYVHIYVV